MIRKLLGEVAASEDHHLVVMTTGGVGYAVCVPYVDVVPGAEIDLWVVHRITERSQTLFGFRTAAESDLFERLCRVGGVGGSTALAVLALPGGVDAVVAALGRRDVEFIRRAKGVGKKTAESIVREVDVPPALGATDVRQQVRTTLIGSGFSSRVADEVAAKIEVGEGDTLADVIAAAMIAAGSTP